MDRKRLPIDQSAACEADPLTPLLRLILALRQLDLCHRCGFHLPERAQDFRNWLVMSGLNEYRALAEDAETVGALQAKDSGLDLPGVAAAVWLSRPDVQRAFPLPASRIGFMQWFLCHGVGEHALWPLLTAEQRAAALQSASWNQSPWLETLHNWASRDDTPERLERGPRPFGVNLVGYAHGQLGIGEDLRMTARALKAAAIPFAVIDFPPGPAIAQNDRSLAGHVVTEGPFCINIFCMTAPETGRFYAERGQSQFASRYNIGYWPWELSHWPNDWAMFSSLVDEVWVSTAHIRSALRTARSPAFAKPVHVMPLVVEVPPDAARLRAPAARRAVRVRFGLPADAQLFCFAFDLNSSIHRKNPQAVVEAFVRAFPPGQPLAAQVGLVVKVQPPRRKHRAWERLKAIAAADPRICVVEGSLPRDELLALYAACDCFVSLHRAEGFGRGLAEALQLGLHLITTDYSGNTDFCRRPEFAGQVSLVPYRLVKVRPGQYPYAEGQVWANPSVAAAATAMRRFVERPPLAPAVPAGGWPCFAAADLGAVYAARLRDIAAGMRRVVGTQAP